MIQNKVLLFIGAGIINGFGLQAQNKDYPIQPVTFTQVHVTDNFWQPKLKVNAEVTIPYVLGQCKKMGRIDNFLLAAGTKKEGKLTEYPFDETDLYKVIEGASYTLQSRPNHTMEIYLDSLISIIGTAQEPDGYLYTFRTYKAAKLHDWIGTKRWEKEEDLSHELYNAGHLYEAATAHYLATGKRNFLNIAIKNADLLVKTFGPGKVERFPGHQIVETGLVKMYRITGKKEYLDLAKFFLDERGKPGHFDQEYSQSQKPVIDQNEAVGHAVRATYMYSGMADVAALTGNPQYLHAIDAIWHDVADKKMYITGGIGATGSGEAFGKAYELPNMSAYAETCAAIANVYWNNRMFLLHGDSKYIDILERTLYNGLLSGVSLSGDRFFYPNPLASLGQHERSAWLSCACCISNMTRFLPSMPGYIYAQNDNDLYLNLFVGSTSIIKLPATNITIIQNTNYPWEGRDEMTINPDKNATFALHVRIPGWALNKPSAGNLYTDMNSDEAPVTILLNGKPVKYDMVKGYAVINRKWNKGDKVTVNFPMEVNKVLANADVRSDVGRFTLQRGPVVYCLEAPDNKDQVVMNIMVDKNAPVQAAYMPNVLNGITELKMEGASTKRQLNSDELVKTDQEITAIPYYAWANRGPAEMEVWIAYEESAVKPKPAPTIASKATVTASLRNKKMYSALNDQFEPQDSKDAGGNYMHWWPKKNTTEWVQYNFDTTYTVSSSKVYWYDDGPWGGCRVPLSWKIYYQNNAGEWIPVINTVPYSVAKDAYNTVQFKAVTTKALKLELQQPVDFSAGIHEWSVR